MLVEEEIIVASELSDPTYLGQERYSEEFSESGQGWGVTASAVDFGLDLAFARATRGKLDPSKAATLLGAAWTAKDGDEVKRDVIGAAIRSVETGFKGYNDYCVNIKKWGKHIKRKPLSRGRMITVKVADAYNNLSAAVQIVNSLCEFLFNINIVDELIEKPFFGDWHVVIDTANSWEDAALLLEESANSLTPVANSLSEWEGEARKAFGEYVDILVKTIESGIAPCHEMHDALNLLAEIVDGALDLIISIVNQVISGLEMLLGECSLGPLGWVASSATIVSWAYDLWNLINDGIEMLNNVKNFTEEFNECAQQINTVLEKASSLV